MKINRLSRSIRSDARLPSIHLPATGIGSNTFGIGLTDSKPTSPQLNANADTTLYPSFGETKSLAG